MCSHGHFDHTTGIDGLIRALGRASMPVLIHPHFWRRRRVVLPGSDPLEIPTTSRRALEQAGFDVIEEQQPSFLLDGSVLITGEVPRVTGYEPGFPPQQAWLGGRWEPDPLVLDDQALIVNVPGQGTGRDHRLRPRRDREHLPLRAAPDRRPAAVRADRRVPPQRAAVRAADPARARRPGRDEPAASWSPPTAPAGGPSTPCRPGSPRRTSPTRSGPASTSDPVWYSRTATRPLSCKAIPFIQRRSLPLGPRSC